MNSLRILLSGLVDYAGLFPPAGLDMDTAVRNYAAYRDGAQAWVLGRFVVPAARLDEFEASAAGLLPGSAVEPWPLSVLAGENAGDALRRIEAFRDRHQGRGARVASVELKARDDGPILAGLPELPEMPEGVELFVELPARRNPGPLVLDLGARGARAKIRTGGVTGDAFPTAAEVARFIAACARARVPFKATAGLHHPVRGEYRLTYEKNSPCCTMFGFLNVFLAAAFARAGWLEEEGLVPLLLESDPDSFSFDDDGAAWLGERMGLEDLRRSRETFALSYGSCSFTEPVEDLDRLHLLPVDDKSGKTA